ncbi:MAG TPA: hypothetical protein VMQ99_14470 [Acetobacteraceae bacterium]|jgi:hypothetical protein|nr:hypothetical protein [Acetobacteraceae bacterium]
MIHHLSISAHDPKHVAGVLAELMSGRCYPFPGGVADSFMAVSGDEHGSMIEVYPEGVTLEPGTHDDAQVRAKYDATPGYVPFHLLLSVPVDRATVERIGEREGWRTRYFGRGAPGRPPFFHVIEFWLENRVMVEVATPDMLAEYTKMISRENLDKMFADRAAA